MLSGGQLLSYTTTATDGEAEPGVEPKTETGIFSDVIFACHPDQAIRVLGGSIESDERIKLLSAFKYARNDTYVHSDESLMPVRRAVWASWNYLGSTKSEVQSP